MSRSSKYDLFFKKTKADNGSIYTCKWCGWERLMISGSSTSPIRWHLEKKHGDREEFEAFVEHEKNGSSEKKLKTKKSNVGSESEPNFASCQSIEEFFATHLVPSSSAEIVPKEEPIVFDKFNVENNEETERIEDAIMTMIATDALPLSTVESPGFQHLLCVLAPNYSPGSREHFERVVMPRVFRKKNQN